MALSPRLNLYSNVKLTFPDTLFLGIKEMRSGELVFFFSLSEKRQGSGSPKTIIEQKSYQ